MTIYLLCYADGERGDENFYIVSAWQYKVNAEQALEVMKEREREQGWEYSWSRYFIDDYEVEDA